MKKESTLLFWTLISTMIITIGAGHGIAPIILIQFWTIFQINDSASYWMTPVVLFSIGQIGFILSLIFLNQKLGKIVFIVSVIILGAGIVSLVLIGLQDYNSSIPTLLTAIPFVYLVGVKIIRFFYS